MPVRAKSDEWRKPNGPDAVLAILATSIRGAATIRKQHGHSPRGVRGAGKGVRSRSSLRSSDDTASMSRRPRCCPGGFAFDVMNRAAGRLPIFDDAGDYDAFERVLAE